MEAAEVRLDPADEVALTISMAVDFGGGLTAVAADFGGGLTAEADFVCDFWTGVDRLTAPPPG